MLSLYEILKASKTGIAPDMWTALAGANFGGAGSGAEVKELTGIPPLSFTADGTPLLDYLISGNMSQSGTPTPDSPVMPQGTGERTGNLAQWEKGGINTSTGANEAYRTKEQGGTCEQLRTQYIPCIGDSTYVLSVNKYPVQSFILFYDENKNYLSRTPGYQQSATRSFRADINAKYMRAQLAHVLEEHVYPAIEENAQFAITLGSTALPYEPYGYRIPISSANTTTPVYLGEVETTRQIKKYECTGEESWQFYSDSVGTYGAWQFYANNIVNGLASSSAQSNIADYGVTATTRHMNPYGAYLVTNGTGLAFQMAGAKDAFTNVTAWKSYLAQQYAAGTPVTVWYVLATPETAVANEPLRKIGDYADTVSMEQAGVEIPTLNGQTVIDVDTTLKPSEVYIKYKG